MMNTWPDRRILDLLGIALPILQAPMAGSGLSGLAIAVAQAGGLGSIPCASLPIAAAQKEVGLFREATNAPLNLNFFCHPEPVANAESESRWKDQLLPYYKELGLDPNTPNVGGGRKPFDAAMCEFVESVRPEVVSFHFGLPEQSLLDRVKATGAKVLSSATTVREALWLESHGCDAVIAQGYEAGGHRGNFLTDNMATQPGTFALVPQIVDAIGLPVIAAGGIGDARGIVAALALGAAAVQMGTAYLFCPEATTVTVHRVALHQAGENSTEVTNVFTGRPARGIVNRLMRELGPLREGLPAFPLAANALAPLRASAEPQGVGDFQPLWAGQSAALGIELPAGELTRRLAREALAKFALW
jgi:nitronate monooxygenase